MNDMHGNSLKTLRHALLAQRHQFATHATYPQAREAVITSLKRFLASHEGILRSVALYYPIQDELDLRPTLLSWAAESGARQLLLPFARPDKHLDFYLWKEGDSLLPSKHGVLEPNPCNLERPQVTPDCILIPCVGWTQSKENSKTQYWRLGYGGGYFDRTLAQLRKEKPSLLCVGVGFDWQKLGHQQWSAQSHDAPLDALLTESDLLS